MTVANFGVDPATFWAFFFFHDSGGGNIYAESSQVLLGPGGSTECEFPPYVFSYPGTYTVACALCASREILGLRHQAPADNARPVYPPSGHQLRQGSACGHPECVLHDAVGLQD